MLSENKKQLFASSESEACMDKTESTHLNRKGFATQWQSKIKSYTVKNKKPPIIIDDSDCDSGIFSETHKPNKSRGIRKYLDKSRKNTRKHDQMQNLAKAETLLSGIGKSKRSIFRQLVSTDSFQAGSNKDLERKKPPPIASFKKPGRSRESGLSLCSSTEDEKPTRHRRKSKRLVLPSDDDEADDTTSSSQQSLETSDDDEDFHLSPRADDRMDDDDDEEEEEAEPVTRKRPRAYQPRYDGNIDKILLYRTVENNARELLVKLEGKSRRFFFSHLFD